MPPALRPLRRRKRAPCRAQALRRARCRIQRDSRMQSTGRYSGLGKREDHPSYRWSPSRACSHAFASCQLHQARRRSASRAWRHPRENSAARCRGGSGGVRSPSARAKQAAIPSTPAAESTAPAAITSVSGSCPPARQQFCGELRIPSRSIPRHLPIDWNPRSCRSRGSCRPCPNRSAVIRLMRGSKPHHRVQGRPGSPHRRSLHRPHCGVLRHPCAAIHQSPILLFLQQYLLDFTHMWS